MEGKKRISRIRIVDLPEDSKVSEEEIRAIKGGFTITPSSSQGGGGTRVIGDTLTGPRGHGPGRGAPPASIGMTGIKKIP